MTELTKHFDFEANDDLLPLAPLELIPEDYTEELGVESLSSKEVEWLQAYWDILSMIANMDISVDIMDETLKEWFEECESDSVNQNLNNDL